MWLNKIDGLPDRENENALSIGDILSGEWDLVVLSNYMTDMDWILNEVPTLAAAKKIVIISGEGDLAHLHACEGLRGKDVSVVSP
eukprot:gene16732-5139_t